ncbi:receptor-like serine/threonine-protein kinase At1g78530 [Cryptomeria japonica]|uniref:receptor-like serine/threonine-protein kinase At1g78530 n=1 Tax=Cryptomeria japonica TaxID=3369 RepID=UPI0027DA86BA|nr:receptor-like serine/threonine-protein kinase At1g78530 [Cryptomeria japonica]
MVVHHVHYLQSSINSAETVVSHSSILPLHSYPLHHFVEFLEDVVDITVEIGDLATPLGTPTAMAQPAKLQWLLSNGSPRSPHDFGIAKLLFENSMTFATVLKGSIGYFAPEYGMGGKNSIRGDVYSYGILLLKLLTRRRPTDNMFVEGINLPKWASMDFPNKITEVVDNHLLRDVDESNKEMVLACLNEFMQIGLICTREAPHQCPTMMEFVQRLEKITSVFLGTPKNFHLPIDISPLLESTDNARNNNSNSY